MKYFIYEDGGTVESEAVLQGMTLTGFLKINKDPFVSNEAVNKEYVDGLSKELPSGGVTTGIMSERRFPDMEGELTSNAGSGLISLSDTGVLAGTYPKVSVNKGGVAVGGENLQAGDIPSLSWGKLGAGSIPNTLSGYGITNAVNKNTGTVLGTLRTTVHPLLPNDAVTKTYLDNKISTVVGYNVGDVITGEWDTTPEGFLQCNEGILNKVDYPILYSVVGDKYAPLDYNNGNGQPWKQQYNINSTGDITGPWVNDINVPPVVSHDLPFFVTKNKVFFISGNVVYKSDIGINGFIAKWENVRTLKYLNPNQLSYCSLTNNMVVLFQSESIIYVEILENGELGKERSVSFKYQMGNGKPRLITLENKLYIICDRITRFTVSKGGRLYNLENISVPFNVYGYQEISVIKDRVYCFGGLSPTTQQAVSSVFYCNILPGGLIGPWITTTSLPGTFDRGASFVTKNRVYLLGGTGTLNSDTRTKFSVINGDGSLGAWQTGGNLPQVVNHSECFITGSRVYLVGTYAGRNIMSASLTGGSNDYSQYYTPNVNIINDPSKFMLPFEDSELKTKYYIKY